MIKFLMHIKKFIMNETNCILKYKTLLHLFYFAHFFSNLMPFHLICYLKKESYKSADC